MIRSLHYAPTDVEARFLGPVQYEEMQRLIHEKDTAHQVRAIIGDRLAIRGSDERPGVGVRGGLPDLVWCPVPPGRVTLEEGAGTFDVADCLIAKYPVTQVQYQLFLDASDGFANPRWWQDLPERFYVTPGRPTSRHGNHPAVNVAWIEAMAYCRWLTSKLGQLVRLPAEWEWQQAASRGDKDNTYPWGERWEELRANTIESQLSRTVAVGLYAQSCTDDHPLDMAGNVWEWCLNKYAKPVPIPETPCQENSLRTMRGGSWDFGQEGARCAYRGSRAKYLSNYRSFFVGFRLLRPLLAEQYKAPSRTRYTMARKRMLRVARDDVVMNLSICCHPRVQALLPSTSALVMEARIRNPMLLVFEL